MFKIFHLKKGCEVTSNYALTSSGDLVDYIGNGEYWYFAKKEDFLVVPKHKLVKGNLAFIIIEPANQDYIKVYKYKEHYIAFDYNEVYDEEGVWYLVKDIKEFKRNKSNSYTFIQYNDNYMEEL